AIHGGDYQLRDCAAHEGVFRRKIVDAHVNFDAHVSSSTLDASRSQRADQKLSKEHAPGLIPGRA
ncbi:MAG: hypothetical protein ACWA5W_00930, partial [Phycisphaerales bacterium]